MDASGNGWISDAIRCYDYCTRQDAHVVSNSWGVYSTSTALEAAAQVCLSPHSPFVPPCGMISARAHFCAAACATGRATAVA